MAFNDGIKVGPIAYIGLVSVLVTFVLVLLLQVLYYQQTKQMREADLAAEGPPPELTELTTKHRTALTKRGYVDQQRGIVTIGIERAKELVVTELADGKSPSEVLGPKTPVAPPKEPPVKEPAAKDAAAKDPQAKATAESDGAGPTAESETPKQPQKKQEPKDDDKS